MNVQCWLAIRCPGQLLDRSVPGNRAQRAAQNLIRLLKKFSSNREFRRQFHAHPNGFARPGPRTATRSFETFAVGSFFRCRARAGIERTTCHAAARRLSQRMGRQWLHAKREVAGLKKGQVVGKLVKEIMVAAKMGGADPTGNARLAAVVEKARRQTSPATPSNAQSKRAQVLAAKNLSWSLSFSKVTHLTKSR